MFWYTALWILVIVASSVRLGYSWGYRKCIRDLYKEREANRRGWENHVKNQEGD